jgi:hypothetical protein
LFLLLTRLSVLSSLSDLLLDSSKGVEVDVRIGKFEVFEVVDAIGICIVGIVCTDKVEFIFYFY